MAGYTTLIDAATLQASYNEPDWVVLDCRFNLADPLAGERAYREGHIPGSFFLDLDQDLSSAITPQSGRHPLPDAQQLGDKLAAMGISKATQVIVYDDCSGMMAGRSWWLLRWLGHPQVALLDGGLQAWQQQGGMLENSSPETLAKAFVPVVDQTATVTTETLQNSRLGSAIYLVDARAAERFTGEVEPIDPVAGHVPGAINRPLMDNLQAGLFKKPEDLRAEWLQLLGDAPAADVVHMCGSGVTACHNLLAMEVAGLSGSRIYPGSWSEWIRDPANPVATGK